MKRKIISVWKKPVPIPFYIWMKQHRQAMNLNLKDMRDLTEITVPRLFDIEQGRVIPELDEVQIIVMGMGFGYYSHMDQFVVKAKESDVQ